MIRSVLAAAARVTRVGSEPGIALAVHTNTENTDAGADMDDVGAEAATTDTSATVEPQSQSGMEPKLVNPRKRGRRSTALLVYGLLPAAVLLLTGAAGYLKFLGGSHSQSQLARTQSVQAATESTAALLSYRPDTIDKELVAATDRLTGSFRDSYTSLVNEVVIPGAKQKQVSAVAAVPAAASVSATASHAIVLVFVNQTITIGNDPPSNTASSVRVTLDKSDGQWLISEFEPV